MRTLKFAVLLLMLAPIMVAARTVELVDPEPIQLAEGSPAQVKKAVKTALLNRNWLLGNEKSGYVEGTYTKAKFSATIAVRWEGRTVRIKYLSSDGLNYEEDGGRRQIHPNYNKWIANLVTDIPIYLQREINASE